MDSIFKGNYLFCPVDLQLIIEGSWRYFIVVSLVLRIIITLPYNIFMLTVCGVNDRSDLIGVNQYTLSTLSLSHPNIPSFPHHFFLSLIQVTVEPGPIVKQSRLANATDDLPGRLTLNARYYLKHNRYHDPLVADDVARNILTESRVTFMQVSKLMRMLRMTNYLSPLICLRVSKQFFPDRQRRQIRCSKMSASVSRSATIGQTYSPLSSALWYI